MPLSLWDRIKVALRALSQKALKVVAGAALTTLLALVLAWLIAAFKPDSTIDLRGTIVLSDAVVARRGADLAKDVAIALPVELKALKLPLGAHDIAGCAPEESSPGLLHVVAEPRGLLRLDHYTFRGARAKICEALGIRFVAAGPGIRIVPEPGCELQIGVGWRASMRGTTSASFEPGTSPSAGCQESRTDVLAPLDVRPADARGLLIEPLLGADPAPPTDLAIDRLSGRTVAAGSLADESIGRRCDFLVGEVVKLEGPMTLTALALTVHGVAFSLRGRATTFTLGTGRSCVADSQHEPVPGWRRVVIRWLEAIQKSLGGKHE
jgi:hypothetical protein